MSTETVTFGPRDRTESAARWAIVLAGGNGTRMRSMIRRWLKEDRPKQFCAFTGTRTMLEHTWDRVARVVPRERIVTVVGPGQRQRVESLASPAPGVVIEQPTSPGTAAAVFLGLAYVTMRDPSATTLIAPADHFVHTEEQFVDYARYACRLAGRLKDRLVLLGARPDRPETDYGWVQMYERWRGVSGPSKTARYLEVRSFHEKPGLDAATDLLASGALWNTMTLAVKARTLQLFGALAAPRLVETIERNADVLRKAFAWQADAGETTRDFERVCRLLPEADFSRDVLGAVAQWIAVLPMENVEWSDWGRPERLRESIARCGLEANVPFGCFGVGPTSGRFAPASRRDAEARAAFDKDALPKALFPASWRPDGAPYVSLNYSAKGPMRRAVASRVSV